jgi:ribosomal protein L37E
MSISEYEIHGTKAGTAYVRAIRLPPIVRCAVCGKNAAMPRASTCEACEHSERVEMRQYADRSRGY